MSRCGTEEHEQQLADSCQQQNISANATRAPGDALFSYRWDRLIQMRARKEDFPRMPKNQPRLNWMRSGRAATKSGACSHQGSQPLRVRGASTAGLQNV
mmetsp:Transcript_6244/g.17926  ORF Transcript_6244/g.17926 Transcript_6244/m.17926 type:complete len:99 (+) Transcript_6244:191-487(+)